MWSSVILCCWVLQGLYVAAGAVHRNVLMEDAHPSLLRSVKDSAFLPDMGSFSPQEAERLATAAAVAEELMMERLGPADDEDEDSPDAPQLQSRSIRSPRRCFRHQESCLGHQLPCCDPCDTCYCRFFNAICYCRRIGQACLHGRH